MISCSHWGMFQWEGNIVHLPDGGWVEITTTYQRLRFGPELS